MSTVTLPIETKDFIPTLPNLEVRKLGMMGKVIRWIRDSRQEGFIYRITVLTLSILTSMVLLGSIVLSPIFIWGYKEFMIQEQDDFFHPWKKNIRDCAMEHVKFQYMHGRIAPLDACKISLSRATKKRIVHDLELSEEITKQISNRDLLKLASLKYDNYLERYDLMVSSRFSITDYLWPFN